MHSAIRPARLNDKFQDPLYLFLELVRAGVMHGHLWSGRAFSGGPSFGTGTFVWPLKGVGVRSHVQARWLLMVRHVLTDDEKSCMLLVMRTLSIVPLNFKVCVLCALCQARVEMNDIARAMVCATVTGIVGVQLVCPIAFSSASDACGGDDAQHAAPVRRTASTR